MLCAVCCACPAAMLEHLPADSDAGIYKLWIKWIVRFTCNHGSNMYSKVRRSVLKEDAAGATA